MSARLRALATELKALRVKSGLNTRQAACCFGMAAARLNRIENAKKVPSAVEVSGLLAIYGVAGAERTRIMQMVEEVATSGWHGVPLDRGRPALANFESEAISIVNFAPSIVPGLLQTPAYVRAITALSSQPVTEHEALVHARLDRQRVLDRLVAPEYVAVLDEAALRRPYGGSMAMAEQINWLIDMAKRPRITIHVIPFRRGGYNNPGYFSLLGFAKALPIVYVEHDRASGFVDDADDIRSFSDVATTMIEIALGSTDSVNFMAMMAADHERS